MSDWSFKLSILALCILSAQNTHAADDNGYSVTGFGTLGVVHSDTRQADFVRDLSQNSGVGYTRQTDASIDSNLGLQINRSFSDSIDAAVQVVSRKGTDDFLPEITWAYAQYNPDDRFQLRAGRLGFDVYMLADSRNIGYSYTWVRPPVDFFGRLIVSYFDGADTVFSYPAGDGILKAKLFYGLAREKINVSTQRQFFPLNRSKLSGGHLEYQQRNWTFRVGYTELKLANEYPPFIPVLASIQSLPVSANSVAASVTDQLSTIDKKLKYTSIGAVYDQGPLQAQFMLGRIESDSVLLQNSDAAYLTMSYRIKKWTPYATASASRQQGNEKRVIADPALSPELKYLFTQVNKQIIQNGQQTFTAGIRYDLGENANIKVQLDHIRSQKHFLIRNAQPGWDGHSNLLSVAYNFVF
ncbi:porin [Undibacterium sp. WLHG33]|uniref:porin n=1 Tax=Undibacterium sp. WLHG33 TaxID=3412482 RepID=UPI003C2CD322